MLHRSHDPANGNVLNAETPPIGRKGLAAPEDFGRRGTTRPSVRDSGPGLAVICAMLFALLWQSLVAQTHRHLDLPLASAQVSYFANGVGGSEPDSPLDSPTSCSICRELAHAGPLLLPAAISIEAPIEAAFRTTATRLRTLILLARAPLWRSRAPPPLQA